MQKIIGFISALCILIILIIACSVNEGIYGEWRAEEPMTVFRNEVNIVRLRTKDGAHFPFYTLIYDDNYHASACQSDDNRMLCMSLLLKTTNIHPTDEISSVVAAPFEGRDYELKTRLEYKLGYSLLYWEMTYPQYNNQTITQIFRRDWF